MFQKLFIKIKKWWKIRKLRQTVKTVRVLGGKIEYKRTKKGNEFFIEFPINKE